MMDPVYLSLIEEPDPLDDNRVKFINFTGYFDNEKLDCLQIDAGFYGLNASKYSKPIFVDIFETIRFIAFIKKVQIAFKKGRDSTKGNKSFELQKNYRIDPYQSISGPYMSFDIEEGCLRGYSSYLHRFRRFFKISSKDVYRLANFLNDFIEKYDVENRYFYVFSYGSNLLLNRIKNRVPSVEVFDKTSLFGYSLLFDKQSTDGSAKANLVKEYGFADVWGVIHKIAYKDKPLLDKAEGLGKGYELFELTEKIYPRAKGYTPLTNQDERYKRATDMANEKNNHCKVFTYIAPHPGFLCVDKPYDWYLKFVIEGAIENEFPSDYIEDLRKIETKKDMDESRQKRMLEILKNVSRD